MASVVGILGSFGLLAVANSCRTAHWKHFHCSQASVATACSVALAADDAWSAYLEGQCSQIDTGRISRGLSFFSF